VESSIRIDIISDVVCPWCIIGFKQLQAALQQSKDRENADIHWHPFELNHHMAAEGQDLVEHISEKYGSTPEQSAETRARITSIGQSLSIEFNYFSSMRIYNTFRAHQLLYWAGEQAKQTDMKMALFDAYFTQQQNLSDDPVLIAAAGSIGLDTQEAAHVLKDERYANTIRQQEHFWINQGIQGVPAMVFNQRYLVSGAQGVEAYAEVLQNLSEDEGV